MIFVATKHQ